MSYDARKPVFGVSDQVRPNRPVIKLQKMARSLGRWNFTIREAKTKVLINYTFTAQLTCSFVFASAKFCFLMFRLILFHCIVHIQMYHHCTYTGIVKTLIFGYFIPQNGPVLFCFLACTRTPR